MSRAATGHIRERKPGLWEGQYVFQGAKRSIYGKTEEGVAKELDKIIKSIEKWYQKLINAKAG